MILAALGCDVTNQQARNFLRSRLGGPSIEEKVNHFIEDYVAVNGSHCMVVMDSDDVMAGLVLISNAQVEVFKRWGEVLLLDWTHNTNNCGFYLGTMNLMINCCVLIMMTLMEL